MDDSFIAKPLGRRQIDQAYPLVRAVAPGLAVEQWRAFAAAVLDTGGTPGAAAGIMTVQNARGYLHGLFTYAIEPHLHHGRVLRVDNVTVLDLFDVPGVAAALLRAMEGLARGFGCTAIHTALPERTGTSRAPLELPPPAPADPTGDGGALAGQAGRNPVSVCFLDAGHRRETTMLCKRLAVVNDNAAIRVADRSDRIHVLEAERREAE